jgi:hypothetical protein
MTLFDRVMFALFALTLGYTLTVAINASLVLAGWP